MLFSWGFVWFQGCFIVRLVGGLYGFKDVLSCGLAETSFRFVL